MATKKEEAKQLDSVTDYIQERELDASKAQEAMSALSTTHADSESADAASQVAVSKEDVALIMTELEVSQDVAEKALRGASGLVLEALRHLVTQE
jgi:NACalpha-BTF3-like transcription factor